MNSRERVRQRDPLLAAILERVYGDGGWRYPDSAPRPFPREAAAKRRHTAAAAAGSGNGEAGGGSTGGSSTGGGSGGLPELAQDNPLQPLLPGGGALLSSGATARRGARRRGGSPAGLRGGGAAGGGSKGRLISLPGRATRALARLVVCCFCMPL